MTIRLDTPYRVVVLLFYLSLEANGENFPMEHSLGIEVGENDAALLKSIRACSEFCGDCPPGLSCGACAEQDGKETRECKVCAAGRFSPFKQATCDICPSGKSSASGNSVCDDCPVGKTSPEGSPECAVPAATTTGPLRATCSSASGFNPDQFDDLGECTRTSLSMKSAIEACAYASTAVTPLCPVNTHVLKANANSICVLRHNVAVQTSTPAVTSEPSAQASTR